MKSIANILRVRVLPTVIVVLIIASCHTPVKKDSVATVKDSTNFHTPDKTELHSDLFHTVEFQEKKYFVCVVNPKKYMIDIHNKVENGEGIYTFRTLANAKKNELVFMVNGGMFQEDGKPLGLFVKDGVIQHPVNLRQGGGNFYLQPNGVFLLGNLDSAFVVTSDSYVKKKYRPRMATQSGPMLVIDGGFNKNFKKGSSNLNIRNGVGVDKKGDVVFIISKEGVNFYELAELFRDKYGCANALYLDGFVSDYYAPALEMEAVESFRLAVFITVSKKTAHQ